MVRSLCWVAVVTCFTLHWQLVLGRKEATCQQVCESLHVPDGCNYSADTVAREEVIMVTDGGSDIKTWKWDTITMVVSAYFASVRSTAVTACYAHSKGKRYGLRERVPSEIGKLLSDPDVKKDYARKVMTYQKLLMADHLVFDLLQFFLNLQANPSFNQSQAFSRMAEVLSHTVQQVKASHDREVYCVVPWQPPCGKSDCGEVRALLSSCEVLLLSPDSYMPVAPTDGRCMAQATVPISRFLYGIDRYISLKAKPDASLSIVAGVPWHGFVYTCNQPISDSKCVIVKSTGESCFTDDDRQRMSLADIHTIPAIKSGQYDMDVLSKGVFYNMNATSQLWFENFTTLRIKYQLVKDLQLRGLSLWYGEDLTVRGNQGSFSLDSWNFLTHNVLHKAVYHPSPITHYYADTVAGVGVGCLLLGTLLGVTFTCIAFQRNRFRKLNRPFKLDDDENAYRDDEGL